jgi:hypothetical protein
LASHSTTRPCLVRLAYQHGTLWQKCRRRRNSAPGQ